MSLNVYVANIDKVISEKDKFDKIYKLMSDSRRNYVDSLKNTGDKARAVCAPFLLRDALRDMGCSEFYQIVKTDENGKPYFAFDDLRPRHSADKPVPMEDRIHFNISHSGSQVICAINDKEVGCDVQEIKIRYSESMCDKFSKAEKEYIKSSDNVVDRSKAFTRIWCIREAYTKYLGVGLKKPMDSFYLDIDGDTVTIIDNDEKVNVNVYEIEINDAYKCAIVTQCKDSEHLNVVRFTF